MVVLKVTRKVDMEEENTRAKTTIQTTNQELKDKKNQK